MIRNTFFDLTSDCAPMEEVRQRVEYNASVKSSNLIILVLAILIACIGLNMNSITVLIGAMLISPLMGGIVAIGYGMAIYDIHLIRRSAMQLWVCESFSVNKDFSGSSMIKLKIIGGLYYGKRKETRTQSTNDRRKTQHHPTTPARV